MIRALPLIGAASLLASCARTLPSDSGLYAGTAAPDAPGPSCPASRATLQIFDGVVIFVPDESTWVLEGSVGPDGKLTADRSRVGVNKQIYDTIFEGRRSGNTIDGTYKTPHCTFRIALSRR